jgi:hypothetical protein
MIDVSGNFSGTPIAGCSICDRRRRARLSSILELLNGPFFWRDRERGLRTACRSKRALEESSLEVGPD